MYPRDADAVPEWRRHVDATRSAAVGGGSGRGKSDHSIDVPVEHVRLACVGRVEKPTSQHDAEAGVSENL